MSESGKVSLPMTPELKEKIKHFYALYIEDRYDLKVYKDPVVRRAYIHISELLAALEEAERRNIHLYDELTEASNEAMKYEEESRSWEERHRDLYHAYTDQDRQLIEAQQTIARQREALEEIAEYGGTAMIGATCATAAQKAIGEGAKES